MERTPTDSRRTLSHSGLGSTFTDSSSRTAYMAHPDSGTATSPFGADSGTSAYSKCAVRPVSAATSRAIPSWLSKSGRFGVISKSSTVSEGNISFIAVPTEAAESRISSPSDSSESPNSFALHIIPSDSTPRSFPTLILKSPGITAPGSAKGTLSPTL